MSSEVSSSLAQLVGNMFNLPAAASAVPPRCQAQRDVVLDVTTSILSFRLLQSSYTV